MAEAMVVEDRSAESKRFFCHMCNVEINIPNSDFTCPLCANGFVEELPANAPEMITPAAGASSGARSGSSGSGSSGSHDTLSRGSSSGGSQVNVESLRNDIVSLLNMRNVPNLEITIEPNRRHSNVLHLGGFGGPSGSGSGGGLTAGGRVRPANLDRLDNVLFDFLQSLPLAGATAEIVTGPGGGGVGGGGNSHMFFMGNPGDYAWGREGLDTIVTQMLNQMETSGPPPLSEQRINEIPNVQISAEEVDRKIQCSICWDDFKIDETVRKLPCSHLYHENCIVPWLSLHSTCPICRKSLADDGSEADEEFVMLDGFGPEMGADGNNSARSSASTATGTDNPLPANNTSSQATADSSQARADAANPAQPARNNVFTFDDDNMFLD
ncbi:E3 ubiquitin-protein ligase Iruka [Drosophila biarmipes]|uniref:E3 ubiquitin-protein ligase Iruka n=1 Tax=Drosophila biarmipes TaxID=125945 RepID=UPI0007E6016E|nr:E3 ubiquitin-protein ligase Iruka [Drosophila biarmipes]